MSQRRLPAEIYWRRRLLLVAVVIALVWVGLQVSGAVGEEDTPKKAATTPTASAAPPTPSPTVAAPPAVQVDGVVDVALSTAATACDPVKIRITPTVKSGQLTRGPVAIGLVVSSTDTKPCTLTPEDADAITVISANGTAIWDSTVCKSSLLTTPVSVSPQWSTLATVQWTGRGSGANCTSNEGWASPGKYTIQMGTLGGEPGKTTFTLDPKPAAPKTPAPDPAATTPAPADPAAPVDPAASADPATPADPSADPPVTPAEG